MHDDGVAGPHARPPRGGPVRAGAPLVVGAHEAFERGLGFLSREAVRIDVKHASAARSHRLGARADDGRALGVAANAVGIGDREPRFVLRAGREIENAAREHVRRHDVDARLAVDALAMQAQQGQGWAPGALAAFAKRNGNAGVTVVVAFDPPLEA